MLLTLGQLEFAHSDQILAMKLGRFAAVALGTQNNHVWPGDSAEFITSHRDPWNGEPVVEPDGEFHSDGDLATGATDFADDVGMLAARRHEVSKTYIARRCGEYRLKDHRVRTVLSMNGEYFALWAEAPIAVINRPEKCGEARARREGRPAEPIDGPGAADECCRLEIADYGVILDAGSITRLAFGLSKPFGQSFLLQRAVVPDTGRYRMCKFLLLNWMQGEPEGGSRRDRLQRVGIVFYAEAVAHETE